MLNARNDNAHLASSSANLIRQPAYLLVYCQLELKHQLQKIVDSFIHSP
jgi:hypothetical protein